MSGFGKDLTQDKIETRLFRKVCFENFNNDGELCFSTENSIKLIARGEFAFVLEKNIYEGMYDDKDTDAGKYYGYDEFRVEFNNINDIISKLENIVIPDSWQEEIDNENFEGEADEDPAEWVENIMKILNIYINTITASEAKVIYGIDFNM